jgi:predicted AlkP superfamily phosphohydrolase/phosphomutase
VLHDPDNPYRDVIRDYYRYIDQEIGKTLELLTEDTIVLLLSDHGARALDGGFCINEWLIEEGLLALEEYPHQVTPFSGLKVDWSRTKAWGEGGYYARVFFNVAGREPRGVVEPAELDSLRNEVKARLEATVDSHGKPLGTLVFKPEEIYQQVRNIPPDLIVHFGGLAWRSIGGVGYRTVHVRENDTGPDDCNHAQLGAFVLAASNSTMRGNLSGVHLLDLAPTLLQLAGYDIPPSMQGTPMGTEESAPPAEARDDLSEKKEAVRDRLRGLGYIG